MDLNSKLQCKKLQQHHSLPPLLREGGQGFQNNLILIARQNKGDIFEAVQVVFFK
jgi:hypothetical protein